LLQLEFTIALTVDIKPIEMSQQVKLLEIGALSSLVPLDKWEWKLPVQLNYRGLIALAIAGAAIASKRAGNARRQLNLGKWRNLARG
jgi:hypothetical protein